MEFFNHLKYSCIKDLGAPALMGMRRLAKRRPRKRPDGHLTPPLKCGRRLREIMTRHYFLARYASKAMPVAWVTSGAPVEILRPFGFYTVYPENHSALCGAQKMGTELCREAEARGYSQDLCSYARIDLGSTLSGKTIAGRLPKPDLLFISNNICQTVCYWFRILAHHWKIPLILFDTPYNFKEISEGDISYMVNQLEEMIPLLERISGRRFSHGRFMETIRIARDTSLAWGRVLDTMKAHPAPMSIFDAFIHLAPVVSLRGLPVALNYYEMLLKELKERIDSGVGAVEGERIRLMWDNIAIWYELRNFSNFFAERGANFVAATYPNAWAETAHFMDELRPFESISKTYSLVILNNNLNRRLDLMEQLIKDYDVDGLVIHSARSCKPYSVGQYDIKRILMERLNIPSIVLEADIADSRAYSEAQVLKGLEIFLESLPGPVPQGN